MNDKKREFRFGFFLTLSIVGAAAAIMIFFLNF